MIIVLLGYMGSGKSTIGKELSKVLKYKFLDLDDYIEKREDSSISDLFQEKGEIYFRKKESQYLNEIIAAKEQCVLALGGGTPCYANNMEMLSDNNTTTIYLKLTIPKLASRLILEKEHRPIISHIDNINDMQEYIGKHLFERQHYYTKANHQLLVDTMSVSEIVEEIIAILY